MSVSLLGSRSTRLFILLTAFFVGNAVVAEFVGVKIFALEATFGLPPFGWNLFGQQGSLSFTAGVLIWPIVFILTDVINEYFGRRGVRLVSYAAIGMISYGFLFAYGAIHLAPAEFWVTVNAERGVPDMQAAYSNVFGQGLWTIGGSITAFFVGQVIDVNIFHYIRNLTGERWIWLRATASTAVSQLIDSFVVLYIAFVLGPQQWPISLFLAVGTVNYCYKMTAAVTLSPLLYLSRGWIEKFLGHRRSGAPEGRGGGGLRNDQASKNDAERGESMSINVTRTGGGALFLLLGYCCCWTSMAAAADAAPAAPLAATPPLEVFGRLPAARLVTLSPNGKLLAMEEDKGGLRAVTIFEADGGKTRHTVDIDKANKVRRLAWSDDETLLVDVSIMHSTYCAPNVLCNNERYRTLSVRMDGSPPRILLNYDGDKKLVSRSFLLASRTGRPGSVTMSTMDWDDGRYRQESGTRLAGNERKTTGWIMAAYDVDTHTGKEKLLASGTQYTDDWVVDATGAPVARSEWLPDYNAYTIVVRQGAAWKEIFKLQDGSRMSLGGLDLAGKAIVALGANGTDRSQAWSIPLDGSAVTSLYAHPEFDVDVAIYDENRNAVVGVRGTSDFPTHWFDPKFESQQKSLENAFKGMEVNVLDRSVVGRRVLVEVDSLSQPPVYQLVDFDQKRADIVAEAYPALARCGTRDGQLLPLSRARWNLDPGVPDVAAGPARQGPAGGDPAARRPGVARRRGVRLAVAIPRHARLCGTAAAIPGFGGLWRDVPRRRLPAMGRPDAGRRLGRRAPPDRKRHGEPRSHLHRGRELRRLCRARGRRVHARPVCVRRQHQRRFRPACHDRTQPEDVRRRFRRGRLLVRSHRSGERPEHHRQVTGTVRQHRACAGVAAARRRGHRGADPAVEDDGKRLAGSGQAGHVRDARGRGSLAVAFGNANSRAAGAGDIPGEAP